MRISQERMGASWLHNLCALLRALSWVIPLEYRGAATRGSREAAPIPPGQAMDQHCCPAGNHSSHCSAAQQAVWIQSPPCLIMLLQDQGTSLCVGQYRAGGRRVAWAAAGKRFPRCEFICVQPAGTRPGWCLTPPPHPWGELAGEELPCFSQTGHCGKVMLLLPVGLSAPQPCSAVGRTSPSFPQLSQMQSPG